MIILNHSRWQGYCPLEAIITYCAPVHSYRDLKQGCIQFDHCLSVYKIYILLTTVIKQTWVHNTYSLEHQNILMSLPFWISLLDWITQKLALSSLCLQDAYEWMRLTQWPPYVQGIVWVPTVLNGYDTYLKTWSWNGNNYVSWLFQNYGWT